MKTICPYCKQLFPETPDEYLGMALECPMCKKEFVCEKVKFCSECGTANSAKSLKCAGCGKFFPKAPVTPQPPFQNQNSNSFAPDDSSEDNERKEKKIPWYKRGGEDVEQGVNIWGIFAVLLSLAACFIPILIVPAIIYALFFNAPRTQRYLALAIVLARIAFNVIIEWVKLS